MGRLPRPKTRWGSWDPVPASRVLELGCGSGHSLHYLAEHLLVGGEHPVYSCLEWNGTQYAISAPYFTEGPREYVPRASVMPTTFIIKARKP
jgi:hypothetical protein